MEALLSPQQVLTALEFSEQQLSLAAQGALRATPVCARIGFGHFGSPVATWTKATYNVGLRTAHTQTPPENVRVALS